LTEKSKVFLKQLSLDRYEEFESIMLHNSEKNQDTQGLNITKDEKLDSNNNVKNGNNTKNNYKENELRIDKFSKSEYDKNKNDFTELSISKSSSYLNKAKKRKTLFVSSKTLNKDDFEKDFFINSSDDFYSSSFSLNDEKLLNLTFKSHSNH
jgi:hypothetical protein